MMMMMFFNDQKLPSEIRIQLQQQQQQQQKDLYT